MLLLLLTIGVADRVYFVLAGGGYWHLLIGPDTRTDRLLVGCLAAYWHTRGIDLRPVSLAVAVCGLPFVIWALTQKTDFLFLTPAVVVLAAVTLLATTEGRTASLLSFGPLRYFGRISYSLYLWHIPILFATAWVDLGIPAALFSIGAAHLSTRYVEQPFRYRRRSPDFAPVPA